MIKREAYLQQIRPFIDQNVVKVLTGIRRCGKSVMLDLIQTELMNAGVGMNQIISINLESGEWLLKNQAVQLYDYVKEHINPMNKTYLFLDEIQEVDGWEKAINAFLVDFDIDIYITGSNAKLLSGELSTYLGGRYVEFNIYPFSFKEVCEISKESITIITYRIYFVTISAWVECLLSMNLPLMRLRKKVFIGYL